MGRVRGHVSRVSFLVHDFVLVMLLLVLLMLVLWEPLFVFFLYHTRSFLRAYISLHASYGDSMASFMNQILHPANPHDMLSALCVSKSWVPKYSLTNPLGSKTWTSLSLSCHMQDGGVGMEDMSFDDLGLLLGVIEIRVVLYMLVHGVWFPVLYCDIFTSLWTFSCTLSLCLLEMWNCSCAHLIS
jgi:hypothetical protein